jgi:hypothetical protein
MHMMVPMRSILDRFHCIIDDKYNLMFTAFTLVETNMLNFLN